MVNTVKNTKDCVDFAAFMKTNELMRLMFQKVEFLIALELLAPLKHISHNRSHSCFMISNNRSFVHIPECTLIRSQYQKYYATELKPGRGVLTFDLDGMCGLSLKTGKKLLRVILAEKGNQS